MNKTIETKHYKITLDNFEGNTAFDGIIEGEKIHYILNQNHYKTKEELSIGIAHIILCDEMCSIEDSTDIYHKSNEIAKELIEILGKL